MTPEHKRAAFAEALVAWFDANARKLPWREARTAYRVWVSEIMLQQTRVSTVIAYFERFVTRLPDVRALAAADVGEVLALWSGLGYYRRARALHEGAREVVARFGGELPNTAERLREIRGIGPYTAGAIASLAFGERTPLVDGNVMRVYARVYGIEGDLKSTATQREMWRLAAQAMPEQRPGAFNEALMELGATVCTPKQPRCLLCPVRDDCDAYAAGRQGELPVIGRSKPVPTVYAASLVARDRDGAVLLARRRGDALFGGLWEPPMFEADDADAAESEVLGVAPRARRKGSVTHVLSHRRMEVRVLAGSPASSASYPPLYDDVRFVAEADFGAYGMSTLARKVLAQSPRAAAVTTSPAPRAKKRAATPKKPTGTKRER